jgi:two-component system, sensor histidine kinase
MSEKENPDSISNKYNTNFYSIEALLVSALKIGLFIKSDFSRVCLICLISATEVYFIYSLKLIEEFRVLMALNLIFFLVKTYFSGIFKCSGTLVLCKQAILLILIKSFINENYEISIKLLLMLMLIIMLNLLNLIIWIHYTLVRIKRVVNSKLSLSSLSSAIRYISLRDVMNFLRDLIAKLYKFRLVGHEDQSLSRVKSDDSMELLRTVSHELRTPINSIISILSLLSDTITEDNKKKLNIAYCSCQHLISIVNDLLDLSQFKAGYLRIAKSTFPIRSLIKESVELIKHQAEMKSLDLQIIINDEIPQEVFTDCFRLKQILLNLLSNALKFTLKGFIKIKLEKYDKQIKLSCEDTGIGIPDSKLCCLFYKFSRVEESASEFNPQGIGLGLYISNLLALKLGGKPIQVVSVAGKGSCFSFFVDYVNASMSSGILDEIPEETCNIKIPNPLKIKNLNSVYRAYKKKRSIRIVPESSYILIADDNCFNVMVFTELLKKENFIIKIVHNGQEAINEIVNNGNTYDLLLIDCEMPVLNGWNAVETLRNMKSQGAITCLPSIVGTTSHCSDDIIQMCISSGMDDVILKPCTKQDLISKIRHWVRIYRMKALI